MHIRVVNDLQMRRNTGEDMDNQGDGEGLRRGKRKIQDACAAGNVTEDEDDDLVVPCSVQGGREEAKGAVEVSMET